MSNVKRGNRAAAISDRPLRVGETIEQQPDGSVLSVIRKIPTTFFNEKTGETIERPSSDARTSRVDMPNDFADGVEPWYLKHMIPCEEREAVIAEQEELKEVEAAARKEFEEKRDAARPINPIRAKAEAMAATAKKTKGSKKSAKVEGGDND